MSNHHVSIPQGTYEVGLLSYKIIGWVCVIFFAGCSIGAYLAHQYGPISIFAFFILMGLYMNVSAGHFLLDQQAIAHRNIFGLYRLRWDEIKQIEIGATDGTLVLHGENKRFVVAPPSMWSGLQKPDAYALLKKKIEGSGIIPYPSNIAAYKIHKNVRAQSNQV